MYLCSWDCGQPSRQSKPQGGAPSRRPPTQTRQSRAGYVRTTQSGTQRWQSATYGHPVTHKRAVIAVVERLPSSRLDLVYLNVRLWWFGESFLPTWTTLHWHRWETWDPWGRSELDLRRRMGLKWGRGRHQFHMALRYLFTCNTPRFFIPRLPVAVGLKLDHNPPALGGICSPGHRLRDQRSNSYWTCRTPGPLLTVQCGSRHHREPIKLPFIR